MTNSTPRPASTNRRRLTICRNTGLPRPDDLVRARNLTLGGSFIFENSFNGFITYGLTRLTPIRSREPVTANPSRPHGRSAVDAWIG
jgi:hypothetical protein